LVILDRLTAALNERLGAYQVVSDMFGLLGSLLDMAPDEVVASAEVLSQKYLEDLETELCTELKQLLSCPRPVVHGS